MGLRAYAVRRIAQAIVIIIGISLIGFVLIRIVPSNPGALWAGRHATQEQMEAAETELGLNKPLSTQYLIFAGKLFQGDLGTSLSTKRPISSDIGKYLPASLELIVLSLIIAFLIGVPLGILSSSKKDTVADHASRVFAIAGVSIAGFWLAMMLQIIFFSKLDILPLEGRVSMDVIINYPIRRVTGLNLVDTLITGNWMGFVDAARHLILPSLVLAVYPMGMFARMTRTKMLEVLDEDYICAARASGLSEKTILFRYAFKPSAGPLLTILGLTFAYMVTSTALVEFVFSWPGLGRYWVSAVIVGDYPAIMGITLVAAIAFVFVNVAVDLMQTVVDPRIKY